MTTENTITSRTVHRLQDVGHRTADRRHESGGAMLLAVHPHRPGLDELVSPDEPGDVYGPRTTGYVGPPGGGYSRLADDVDPDGSIRAQGEAIGAAYRRVAGTYAALGQGVAAGFRGEGSVPPVGEGLVPPPDTSRPVTAAELARISRVLDDLESDR